MIYYVVYFIVLYERVKANMRSIISKNVEVVHEEISDELIAIQNNLRFFSS